MKGKWVLFSVAAIVIGVAAGAFSLRHRKPPQPSPSTIPAAAVLPSQITLTGKIRAAQVVGVSAPVPGNIDAFLADVGDEVYAGQQLARIGSAGLTSERDAAAAAVEQAQARLDAAEKAVTAAQLDAARANAEAGRARTERDRTQAAYERQKVLNAAGATPRLTYEKAARDAENAGQQFLAQDKAARAAADRVDGAIRERDDAKKILADKTGQLNASTDALGAAVITAPVDGLIVGRKGEAGQPAQEFGNQLFEIAANLFDLEVAVAPPPDVLKKVFPGEPVLVVIPDIPNSGSPGTVKAIQGTQAIIAFTNSIPAIRPGMQASVRLQTP